MSNTRCPICKNTISRPAIKTPKMQVWQCGACGVSFVPKRTIQAPTDVDYFDTYALDRYIGYYKPFRTKVFKENWKVITGIIPTGRAIDVGASFGWFIACAPKGWNVEGIDKSRKVAEYASASGIKVTAGDETVLKARHEYYDAITLHNVFEHLANPLGALGIFHKALKRDGLLVLAIPNKTGLFNRLAYLLSLLHIYHPLYIMFQMETPSPHYMYYSRQTIADVLRQKGFTPLIIKGQPIIDIANLDRKLQLEGTTNWLNKLLAKIGVFVVYHLSILLDMPDEIIVYAAKRE